MDFYKLNLNPAITSSIFTNKNDFNNSFDQEKNICFDLDSEQEENFNDNFNQIFNEKSFDKNNDNSISEIDDNLNNDNIDDFIIYFQKKLSYNYFKKDFDGIISKIENKFKYFFNEKNNELLYMIEKLKFFKYLGENNIQEAIKFYNERLLTLIKEVKKNNWENKSKFFLQLIKRPNLIGKPDEFLKKYYDKFTYELDKAIRIFLHANDSNQNYDNDFDLSSSNIINKLPSSSSEMFSKISSNEINFNSNKFVVKKFKEEENIKKINNNEENNNKDDLDLDNLSTKEEFSDFEDEIQPKMCADTQEEKNLEKINENQNNINSFENESDNIFNMENFSMDPVNNNFDSLLSFSKIQKNSFDLDDFKDEDENNDEYIINTTSKKSQINIEKKNINNENNFLITNTKSIKIKEKEKEKEKKQKINKQKKKEDEIIFNQLPFLNSFKPRYIKRETIDKKIIRNFKNYVVKENKEKRLELNNPNLDQNFFINLINGSLLPPIDFFDIVSGENVKFKSFNCNYLLWFFSKKGVKDIYFKFINEKGKEFINNLTQYYEISQEEKAQLNNYINNYPFIFDLSIVKNITQGAEITHLYRTVDKNRIIINRNKAKKENELDLRKKKSDLNTIDKSRERYRSRDFNDNEDY